MTVKVSLTVNGKPASAEVEERTLLVNFIRDTLRLTGTHVGCDTAQCGACTIHMNGRAVKSCNMLAMQAEGADLVTIEGIAKADGTLHPMQEAFRQHHGLQCGFCTPGMVMSAIDLGKFFTRSIALMTMPGVQKPHCRPWCWRNASCIGCRVPSALAMPSIVTRSAPSACIASMLHDFTARPFMWMVHAPHWAVSQPTWVPVRRKLSRMKLTSRVRSSTSALAGLPLTVNETFTVMIRLLR